MPDEQTGQPVDIRALLRETIARFEHVLPGQAALGDFVHHNTLHGFQHLPFPQALAAAHKITGARGYLPQAQFQDCYRAGRIDRQDLEQVLNADPELEADAALFNVDGKPLTRRDVMLAALLHPVQPITGSQFGWEMEERNALAACQGDVEEAARSRLLEAARRHGQSNEAAAVGDLWNACLQVLHLEHYLMHPEELQDISPERAEQMLAQVLSEEDRGQSGDLLMDRLIYREARSMMDTLFERLGHELTLATLLRAVTGEDLMETMRPLLVRHVGSFLDQGLAAWHAPDRQRGFYAVWRDTAMRDPAWMLDDLPDWRDSLDALPDDPLDVILVELRWLGLDQACWVPYLERLALELPGWSGMFLWRHGHPGYVDLDRVRVDMADYLAVRLVLERLFAQRLCREQWMIEASFDILRWYFRHNHAEFLVRYSLYNLDLPEYLVALAQGPLNCSALCAYDAAQWQHLAHMIRTWRHSMAADRATGFSVHDHAWRLFRLAQHLGLCGAHIRALNLASVRQVFECMDNLDPERAGFLWLQAYERHYREQLFSALAENHGRGRWSTRDQRPEAQLVFCMDDREEGFRRHLEEHNPNLETLGAAGFFGVAVNWRGLDDSAATALCPVMITPTHEVHEVAQTGQEPPAARHGARRARRLQLKELIHQETRRNLLRSTGLILLAAPAALAVLIGKVFVPLPVQRLSERLRRASDGTVATRVDINACDDSPATPQHPRAGFTDTEQADRVQGLLRSIGLQKGFAPLVVLMGHGSASQNNPHLAAYDCGACSGRHGGPNARIFAAMANRPEVRALLRARGIDIPRDTWFLGAEHNTCDESVVWYDLEVLPPALQQTCTSLEQDLKAAALGSSHERARRLASAPHDSTPQRALSHSEERACDFSQARPELGHANNAAALVGRRSMSQGAFFDRRVFLISYDPTQDPHGSVLESILLATAPVGAGINLEYYFSTVDNERYGCGSKVTHNVTGLFGVMEGTSSDLRTGLPKQMIEIHEAMRLLVVVESRIEVLTRIYERQPSLRELIGNGWLLLAVKDPDSRAIHLFEPGRGFTPWHGNVKSLPRVARSPEWYRGHQGPLTPALVETPQEAARV